MHSPQPPSGPVLSLDPGIRTGWATWTHHGILVDHGIMDLDATMGVLARARYAAVVFEDYRLRYGRAPAADSHHTASRIIGAVELLWWQGHIGNYYEQEVEVLQIESLHLGLKRPKNHKIGHDVDAILHGGYWFRRVGIEPDISGLG